MNTRHEALVSLLAALRDRAYAFTTPTPATHARVIARANKRGARDLRDVFGWSLPFERDVIGAELLALMQHAEVLDQRGGLLASKVRVSSLDHDLFLHSAYPTIAQEAVFFGPDSYRFAGFLRAELPRFGRAGHLVDVGAGAGVGALVAARSSNAAIVTAADINPAALDLARANLAHAGLTRMRFQQSDALGGVPGEIHIVVANPPYIVDSAHRAYRDGGALYGGELSLRWAHQAAARLAPGGALLLYTGSAIVDGEDRLKAALFRALSGFDITYHELDPDVFGEELEREDYFEVERIAVVGAVAVKP